jgi:hypothetical protein
MTITQKKLPLKRGDNLKIQKVSNSEKIQKVDLNVEKQKIVEKYDFFFTSSVKKLAKFHISNPGHFLSSFVLSKLLISCLTCLIPCCLTNKT